MSTRHSLRGLGAKVSCLRVLTVGIGVIAMAQSGLTFTDGFNDGLAGWDTSSYRKDEVAVVTDNESAHAEVLYINMTIPMPGDKVYPPGKLGIVLADVDIPADAVFEFDVKTERSIANIIVNFRIGQLNEPKTNTIPNRFRIWTDYRGNIHYQKGYIDTQLHERMKKFWWRTRGTLLSKDCGVNDGKWHHIIAEVDRKRPEGIDVYVDGKLSNGEWSGRMNPTTSLSTTADFLVGKAAASEEEYFAGQLDFLRVSRGTLADAETTIEELYRWEFDGPFLKDFRGEHVRGKCRDAGAVEHTDE